MASKPYDLLIWLILALTSVFVSRYSQIDWQVASYFHGTGTEGFPLRNSPFWLTAHELTRQFSGLIWAALLLFTWRKWQQNHAIAAQAGSFILLASLFALAINGLLKTSSAHSCPWSLTAFGGSAEFFRMLDPVPLNAGQGRCLPSGHAAVGFMWWPVVYACARWRPSFTTLAFAAVMSFGAICGVIQIVRGAHFVSHVLMTSAVTGACSSLAFHLLQRTHPAQRSATPIQLT